MKDRFKFRIWRPTNTHIIDWKPQFIYQDILEADYCVIRQDNDVYEFCTGLKDKNGKLIYEGDIIQTDYEGVELDKYIYRWESPAFYVEPIEKGKPTGSHYYYYAVCTERCTVIGNIHENPELLKESK